MHLDKHRQPKRTVRFAWIGVFVALSGCVSTHALDSNGYQSLEMRSDEVRPVIAIGDQNVAWIDDDHVLFEGWHKTLKDPVERNYKNELLPQRGLYIWDIRKGTVTKYTKEPLRYFMCFSDGFISYWVLRNGTTVRLEGPFGHEKEIYSFPNRKEWRLNPFTCESYEISNLPKPIIGGGIEPLRKGHGWLEHTGQSAWLRTEDGALVQLMESGRILNPVKPQKYSDFAGKYLFWRPSRNETLLISPEGLVEAIPALKLLRDVGPLEPAFDNAILFRSSQINVRASWDPGNAGLYKYAPQSKSQRLAVGLIRAMRVHRGGCWVAIILDPWDEHREQALRALNICK